MSEYAICGSCYQRLGGVNELETETTILQARVKELEESGRWIPSSERLPEEQEQVLVQLEPTKLQCETDKEVCRVLTAARHEDGWYDFQSDEDIDESLTTVTGWVALPPDR